MIVYTLLLFVGVFLGVVAQLSLKYGIDKLQIQSFRKEGFGLFKKFALSPFIVLGFFSYGLSLLLWLVILSQLELSYAYPMISSAYFFVALGSFLLFKEKVSWQRWCAIGVIILGVVIVGLS
jgi:drug/metabolite transporter (DMT)-like permease